MLYVRYRKQQVVDNVPYGIARTRFLCVVDDDDEAAAAVVFV